MKVKILIKTDLSGFVVTMHSGMCDEQILYIGLTVSELDFLSERALDRALWEDNQPAPVLILKQILFVIVKPVYNDHLMGYFSAIWSSSRWPRGPEGRNW